MEKIMQEDAYRVGCQKNATHFDIGLGTVVSALALKSSVELATEQKERPDYPVLSRKRFGNLNVTLAILETI